MLPIRHQLNNHVKSYFNKKKLRKIKNYIKNIQIISEKKSDEHFQKKKWNKKGEMCISCG